VVTSLSLFCLLVLGRGINSAEHPREAAILQGIQGSAAIWDPGLSVDGVRYFGFVAWQPGQGKVAQPC